MYFVHCIGLSLSARSEDSNEPPVRFGGDRIHHDKGLILVSFESQEEVFHYQNIHPTDSVSVEHQLAYNRKHIFS